MTHPPSLDYPLDTDGLPFTNYVQVPESARPDFGKAFGVPPAPSSRPTVAVIGAGYIGLSAALRLAERRQESDADLRIVALEARHVGSGPSGKSGGHICGLHAADKDVLSHCGPELESRLIAAAADASRQVRALIDQYAIPCDPQDGYIEIGADGQQRVVEGGLV